jgi:hypothetical protein
VYRGFGVDANGECIQLHFSTLRGIWQGVLARYYPTEVKRIRKVGRQGGLGSFHMGMLGVGNSKDYPPQRIGLYASKSFKELSLDWRPKQARFTVASCAGLRRDCQRGRRAAANAVSFLPTLRGHAAACVRGSGLGVLAYAGAEAVLGSVRPASTGRVALVYTQNRLERHFRDAQTLRHHGFVSANRYEAVGQV